jgi:hypothetical protein
MPLQRRCRCGVVECRLGLIGGGAPLYFKGTKAAVGLRNFPHSREFISAEWCAWILAIARKIKTAKPAAVVPEQGVGDSPKAIQVVHPGQPHGALTARVEPFAALFYEFL